jgi:hypothetical protein
MRVSGSRASQLSGGIFLIGLGLLFVSGYWWPGILFVIGAGILAQGMAEGRSWYACQGAFWMIGLGIWFALGSSIGVLFVLLGVSVLFGAIFRPPFLEKPKVKNWLE